MSLPHNKYLVHFQIQRKNFSATDKVKAREHVEMEVNTGRKNLQNSPMLNKVNGANGKKTIKKSNNAKPAISSGSVQLIVTPEE